MRWAWAVHLGASPELTLQVAVGKGHRAHHKGLPGSSAPSLPPRRPLWDRQVLPCHPAILFLFPVERLLSACPRRPLLRARPSWCISVLVPVPSLLRWPRCAGTHGDRAGRRAGGDQQRHRLPVSHQPRLPRPSAHPPCRLPPLVGHGAASRNSGSARWSRHRRRRDPARLQSTGTR